jgi:hypothetical protein
MALRRGFKTEAASTAGEVRAELGLGPLDRLDPLELADWLDIPVVPLSELADRQGPIRHLLDGEPEAFSTVTVFRGVERTIVHNDAHTPDARTAIFPTSWDMGCSCTHLRQPLTTAAAELGTRTSRTKPVGWPAVS